MTERKPRLDSKVPTYAIDRKLGRTHVMTPDEDVVEMIEQMIEAAVKHHPEQAATWTPTIRRQTVRYALWRHHKNRDQYIWVMGGHPVLMK
jgi:hypothetical protein